MKSLWVIVMLLIIQVAYIQNLQGQDINWFQKGDWERIKNKAKSEGKYIFIDCYASWCLPCKRMDKEIYTNDSLSHFFNQNFVSLKLQFDSTGKDDQIVREMYGLAKKIDSMNHVSGFPTLLFYSNEGILTSKALGFKDTTNLIQIAKDATSPDRLTYYKQLQKYNSGERDYKTMQGLAIFVANVLGNRVLAKQIANEYVNHVDEKELLNISSIYFVRDVARNFKLSQHLAQDFKEHFIKMPVDSLFTKANLRFIDNYNLVLQSDEPLFQIFKTDSVKLDSIMNLKGWAKSVLGNVVMKEELEGKLVLDNKPVLSTDPNWEDLKSIVKKKYSFLNTDKLVLDFQIGYYRAVDLNWEKWAEYKQERIKKYPPNPYNGVALSLELNDGGAWDAFLNCNDKNVLKKTLSWADLAITLFKTANPKEYPDAFLDTKANVLYKIGRTIEAIKIEKEVLSNFKLLTKDAESTRVKETIHIYNEVLENMKEGKPTYLEQGAKWNDYTLPKKQDSQISSSKR